MEDSRHQSELGEEQSNFTKTKKNQYAEVMSHLQNTAENPDHNLLINEDSPD